MTEKQRRFNLWAFLALTGLASWAVAFGYANPQYVPQQVLVPTYNARYGADAGEMREMLTELRAIKLEIQLLRQLNGGRPSSPPSSVRGLFELRCASCHAEPVAAAKGGEFVLLTEKGDVAMLSPADKRRIMREVKGARMPKGGPALNDAELRFLEDALFPKEASR